MKKNHYLLVILLTLLVAASLPFVGKSASADHRAECAQWDGSDGDDTIEGLSMCDEMWTYGGHDVTYGRGDSDELHMGSGYDWAHGNQGADIIYGGDNGTTNKDELFGLDDADRLYDNTGPDADLLCGGNHDDRLDAADGDNNDYLIGENGSDNLVDGGDGDFKKQDGTCA